MTRSPDKPKAKSKSDNQLIMQLLILGLVITLLAMLVVQNLQPLVEIFFLGQKTLPIPLSVAMLVAFVVGGVIAYAINTIADWQQNKVIRRAAIASNGSRPNSTTNSQSQPVNKSTEPENPDVSNNRDNSQDFIEDDEDYEDDEYYDDDEDYEDDDNPEILDDDPDTIPYGDRFKYKSKQSPKSDRPPLEAKYIK